LVMRVVMNRTGGGNQTNRADGRLDGAMDDGGRMDVLMLPTKLYMLL
jgi:hypothetical protein